MVTLTSKSNEKQLDEAALLQQRLQSQFGDLDISSILKEEEKKDEGDRDADDDSSIEEPSAEELAAWQAAQFQKGKVTLDMKKRLEMTPLQRRREWAKQYGKPEDEDDWEEVAASPDLGNQTSSFFTSDDVEVIGAHPVLQQLAQGDPEVLGTKWRRLYSSIEGDGLSFTTLLACLQGYPGPTVLLIGAVPSAQHNLSKDKPNRSMLGFYTTSQWEESHEQYGSNDCFLFKLDEQDVHILRPQPRKNSDDCKAMYCHPSLMKKTSRKANMKGTATDGLVHGIGVGGSPRQPRLHLTESLEECRAMTYDGIFEDGDLLNGGEESLYYFDVDCLEVWGVGGDDWIQSSLEQRQRLRSLKEAQMEQSRKIKDKSSVLSELRFLSKHSHTTATSMGMFDHISYSTDRCDL